MDARLNAHAMGAAVLFTELVDLKWDGACIVMVGRSGDYVASGHMTPAFASDLYEQLGRLLADPGANVVRLPERARSKPPKRGGKRKKKR